MAPQNLMIMHPGEGIGMHPPPAMDYERSVPDFYQENPNVMRRSSKKKLINEDDEIC
jgi:hypothetical protein